MTTYKLPDWLGGAEVTGTAHARDDHGEPMVWVMEPGTTRQVLFPCSLLTEVLPPEPVDGTVFCCYRLLRGTELGTTRTEVSLLWRDDWSAGPDAPDEHWFSSFHGTTQGYRWNEVQPKPDETHVRMVKDPAADAPVLPWTTDNLGDGGILVERDPFAGEALRVNGRGLSANAQRDLLAILARQLKPGAERDALFAAAEAGVR